MDFSVDVTPAGGLAPLALHTAWFLLLALFVSFVISTQLYLVKNLSLTWVQTSLLGIRFLD